MRCPKCEVEMRILLEDGIETDECPKCGGVWVDNIEEKDALKMKPAVFTVEELKNIRNVYEPLGREESIKYYRCPRCNKFMWRKNYLHHSGIVIDKCKEHGAFFDKGELEKAAEFIKKGGAEYEKLRIAEKGITGTQNKLISEINRVDRQMWRLHYIGRILSMIGL